jgi:eukaryotic-like serine/threonine-protein kinase
MRMAMTLPKRERWKQLSPLLDQFLDLCRSDQRARLDELRGSGDALAGELESLLAAANRAQATQFMDGVLLDHERIQPSLAGKQVGRHVIETLLGEGATGTVWRAREVGKQTPDEVAIKLLHRSLMGGAAAHRFRQEGSILALVSHPNISRLLDAGVTAQGQPYLVLELVDGLRIDHHCDARRLNVRERIELFMHVLAAVSHVHANRVLHRDIKPNNICVTAAGQVKLLDFGIARLLHDDSTISAITTRGVRIATPLFAAPEQLLAGSVSPATDTYALGVLLYQLLAGQHPTAQDPHNLADVVRTTLESEPLPLGRALGAGRATPEQLQAAECRATPLLPLRRQLQGGIQDIVSRALRKEPERRYATVADMQSDLRQYLARGL